MGIFKKRSQWWIDYRVKGRRYRECIGINKAMAKDVLAKRKGEIAEARFFPERSRPKILFRDMTKLYFEKHSLVNKRSSKTDSFIISHLNQAFGDKYLHEVTPFMVEEYRANRREMVKPATVNREFQLLRHLFNKAIRWNFSKDNPARGIQLFRVDNRRLRFLSSEEISALTQACDDRLKPIVTVALHSGMRRGELFRLKWADIDLKRGIIYVLHTKSGKPREIPLNNTLSQVFKALPKSQPYVFETSNIRKRFEGAMKNAGIMNASWHTLRHSMASHMIMGGVDLMTVKDLLGHETIEMTLRYSHLSPDHKRIALQILDSKMDTIWTPRPKVPSGKTHQFARMSTKRALSSVG